jgi:hypothetical protein
VRRSGIRVHRHAALRAEEVTVHDGIPVTPPARTLLDLAATFPRRTVERALDQADILRLVDRRELERTLEAHRVRRGSPSLRAVLEHRCAGSTLTRSELEDRERDAVLAAHGIRTLRFTARQVTDYQADVVAALSAAQSL